MRIRDTDLDGVRRALTEAARAAAAGDVPVGAVVLGPDGEVLAAGRNEREAGRDPTLHAEIVAIRAACRARGEWRLADCTLAVTLEPCAMCAGAILAARIPRVVFGAWDEKAGAAGSVYDLLRDRRLGGAGVVEVVPDVLADEAGRLLEDFFAGRRRP